MKIGDEPYSAFTKARRRGRTRTADVTQLAEAIRALGSGKAKSVMLEPGQNPRKLRLRLHYAATIAGRKIRVVVADDRVVFVLARGNRHDRRAR